VDLRKRLARMDTLSRRHQPEAEFAAPGDGDPEAVREQLGLQVVSSPAGDVWQREDLRRDVPLPAGPVPDLSGFLPAGTPRGLRWQDVLFLDTETTGLSGGTGTLVFLMGLAWWDDDGAFRVRQMFLPGPGREGAMLQGVADLAADRQVVATYNGASFDLPLVRTRARLNRRPDPVAELVSWDLLVAARRSWGRALENCRQQTVETAVCGRERGVGDIDGALIPATYQRFLHASELGDLPQVRDTIVVIWMVSAWCWRPWPTKPRPCNVPPPETSPGAAPGAAPCSASDDAVARRRQRGPEGWTKPRPVTVPCSMPSGSSNAWPTGKLSLAW